MPCRVTGGESGLDREEILGVEEGREKGLEVKILKKKKKRKKEKASTGWRKREKSLKGKSVEMGLN